MAGADRSGIAFRLLGAALLAVPFLPLPALFGPVDGASALVGPGEWVLGLAIFGAVAWIVALGAGERIEGWAARADGALERRAGGVEAVAAVLLGGLLLAASRYVFHHRPLLVDSVVQLFQAKIFAAGMVEAPPPEPRAFFATLHMVVDPGGWYAQYPPGHAALLAVGLKAGAAWLVPVVLSIGSLTFLVGFVRRAYDRATAGLVALLLVLCPFFWFLGASFMNHVSTLFFVTAFLYAWIRWEEGRAGWLALAGAALGGAFLSRPLTALAIGVPFAAWGVAEARTRRRWRDLPLGAAAFLAVAGIYLWFNAATTGDPLLPGYIKLWGADHGLGFHRSPWGEMHTPLKGLRNELVDLSLLNVFLFEWPIPSLLPLGVLFAAGWGTRRWDRRLLVAFLAIPAAYFFYWHRDAYLGPRFLYSGIAFAIPLTARAVLEGVDRLRGRWLGGGGPVRAVPAGGLAAALLALSVAYGLAWGVPQRFVIYATGLSSMKVDLVGEARAAGIDRGLVFVATSWGNRLIAQLYGEGVSASLAERAYREADHCRLQQLLDRARSEGWSADRLSEALEGSTAAPGTLVEPALNGDPTMKLAPGPLADRCVDEIRYDEAGYTVYVPHLLDDDPRLVPPWVVARDLRGRNRELMARYPDLPAWRYRKGRFERLPSGGGSTGTPPGPAGPE